MWLFMAGMAAAGVSFYLRFLIALCGELRSTRMGRLVRLRSAAHEQALEASPPAETEQRRAA